MRETLVLILKGIIIGIGKIIPGVSGGMLAISLNVYDKSIEAISNFFKDIKSNTLFLTKLGLGIIIAIVLFSKIINYSLTYYYLPTMLFFIGLIIGGIPSIIKETKKEVNLKNINLSLIAIIFILGIGFLSKIFSFNKVDDSHFFILIIMGIIEALTMIIPGISGTAILMMLGYYNLIIEAFSNLTVPTLFMDSITILIPFGIGIILGVICLVKVINLFLNKYRIKSYYLILGFVISSIFLLLVNLFKLNYSISTILFNILFLVIGFIIGNYFEKK